MILTYQPEGQDEPQTWVINLGKMRTGVMEAIEHRTKMAFGTEFRAALLQGNTTARKALLWTKLREKQHTIKFEDVDFANDELKLEMDADEWAEQRALIEKNRKLSDATKAEMLDAIDIASADAPEPPGKSSTPSETSETSTD